MGGFLTFTGLVAYVTLIVGMLAPKHQEPLPASQPFSPRSFRLLAVGDINLGRTVGQRILAGDTLYPFRYVRDELIQYDLVFGNLECQLSDQGGETQHPVNNLIFTGPPAGAAALALGGIGVVSTANNHALDYGIDALDETLGNLSDAGISAAGTGSEAMERFRPALLNIGGVRIALFACTDIMNIEDRMWTSYVAEADTAILFPRIRQIRGQVDIVILSYHGGHEYASRPTERTRRFARGAVDAGVDLFLGHHPHVPQEIEERGNGVIAYSLGNFVFRQPFDYWTRRSFALEVLFHGEDDAMNIRSYHVRPVEAGDQPRFLSSSEAYSMVHTRTKPAGTRRKDAESWYD